MKASHIELTDENWTITDVSVAGDIPKGEDLSESLGSMLLLYLSLLLGLASMPMVYLSPFLQFSAQNCFEVLSPWTDSMWRQKYTLRL